MSMFIGDRELVYSASFIMKTGETATFEFSPNYPTILPGTVQPVTFNKKIVKGRFTVSDRAGTGDDDISATWTEGPKTNIQYTTINIDFPAVADRAGAVIMSNMKIGEVDGKILSFVAAAHGAGTTNIITLQFMLGGFDE